MSEPSASLGDFINGWKQRRVRKSKSEGQGKSFISRDIIETSDLKEGSYFVAGFGHSVHFERRV
jgi:hypothetical protein